MIPQEIVNINKFKSAFPFFLQKIVIRHPLNLKLRKMKKWAINQINNLNFDEYNSMPEDEIYDATIMCVFEKLQINCPVSINIKKLTDKVKNNPTVKMSTEDLYDLVHQDVRDEYFKSDASQICPPILLCDDCFGCQLIDGNHRVVCNYRSSQMTTDVVLINGDELKNCLEFDEFEVIIDVFSKLNNILNRYTHW